MTSDKDNNSVLDVPQTRSARRERELMRSNSERDRHIGTHHKSRNYMSLDRELPAFCGNRDNMSVNEITNFSLSILAPETREQLIISLDKVIEKTQDFTDSAYTTHEHRENILLLCDRSKLELNQLLRIAVNMEKFPSTTFDIDTSIESVLNSVHDLSHQLTLTVADQTAELVHTIKIGIDLVNSLRNIAINHELDRLQECADRFHDYIDHILEVCKLLRHIALSETLQVQSKFTEINLRIYGPQVIFIVLFYLLQTYYKQNILKVITAARALSSHPSSKITKENLEVFADMWQWLASDISSVSKEIIDMSQSLSRPDCHEYLSLPRPGVSTKL